MFCLLPFAFISLVFALSLSNDQVLHFRMQRRGDRFVQHEPANLTRLSNLLRKTEDRYSRTFRNAESNQLVRRWRSNSDLPSMLDEAGSNETWYITLLVGEPSQILEFDLNFLSPDFYTILTTSTTGSKFNTFASQSHVPGNSFVHPLCRLLSDILHISNHQNPIQLEWPICQPSKSSRHTLSNSGNILGVGPYLQGQQSSLSRFTASTFIEQLRYKNIIRSPLWSFTLLDSSTGIVSLGGTLATQFEEAKTRAEVELKYLDQEDVHTKIEDEVKAKMAFAMPETSTAEDHFKWTDVSGASGWWTGLMNGVWVDGVKILRNQPFLIDLSCPFVIAPPSSFEHLYKSISGSRAISPLDYLNNGTVSLKTRLEETFHLFPCLSPPIVSFELGGWPFPLASPSHITREDAIHGPAGGLFSLGKVEPLSDITNASAVNRTGHSASTAPETNSGFCVGIVVSSDMGERMDEEWRQSGMRDTWVLGEPFFRGMGVVFDDGSGGSGKARIGFRMY